MVVDKDELEQKFKKALKTMKLQDVTINDYPDMGHMSVIKCVNDDEVLKYKTAFLEKCFDLGIDCSVKKYNEKTNIWFFKVKY